MNQDNIDNLSAGLQTSADQVAGLTRDFINIEKNVNGSIGLILNTVQSESEYRRKMVESFKNMSELVRQCKEGKNVSHDVENEEQIFNSIHEKESEREKVLLRDIESLTLQLKIANEQIKALQQNIRDVEQTRLTLTSENRQLGDLNYGYKVEIEKQMSIFQRLNQLLQTVRQKVSKFLEKSDKVQHNVTMYVADGILAEIRNDVLRGPTFSYINNEGNISDLVKRVQVDIQSKWIQQLISLISDLETIIKNMITVGDTTSIITWTDYKTKLTDFLKLWTEKSVTLIQSWITKRQKRSHQ
jgi:hypothetical protein